MSDYQIILADPPWRFSSNSVAKPGRNAMRHYPCMPIDEIHALPVELWAADDALLFMWATAPMVHLQLPVMESWGFKYVSQIIWVKRRVITGFWVRNRHEILLIGKRGSFPCPASAPFTDSVIVAPQREHSRKPRQFQDRIDEVWPDHRKLEMFAREQRPGWDAWGNEIDKFAPAAS